MKDLLGAVAAGTDLQKRYLKKLDADETELESARAELSAREKAKDAAQKATAKYIAGF